MIQISRFQRDELDRVGLLKYKRTGYNAQDQNFVVVNREHVGRNKTYYVVETPEVLLFLQQYDTLNLQRLRPDQLQRLKDDKLVKESQIQYPGEYKPAAFVFVNDAKEIRMKKIATLMIHLGIWKSNKSNNSN